MARATTSVEPQWEGEPTSVAYDGFLSYSREDTAVATALQRGLHRVGRRVGRLRALRIFRDETDIEPNPDLWGKVQRALDGSRFLIVVCSPHAAGSTWVSREIDHWTRARGTDHLLLVLRAGELVWDASRRAFDPSTSTAAPASLCVEGALATEPVWVTIGAESSLDLEDPDFRRAVIDVAAPLHSKSKEELAGEDHRELRRFRRYRRLAVSGLVLLLMLALVAAAIAQNRQREADAQRKVANEQRAEAEAQSEEAETQRAEAEAQRAEAETQRADAEAQRAEAELRRDEAVATQLAVESRNMVERNPALALALAAESAASTPEPLDVSLDVLLGAREAAGNGWAPLAEPLAQMGGTVGAVAFSGDGKSLAAASDPDGSLGVWDTASWARLISTAPGDPDVDDMLAVNTDGSTVATVGGDGRPRIWDVASGEEIVASGAAHDIWRTELEFSPDGSVLVSADSDGSVILWNATTGRALHPPLAHSDFVSAVEFLDEGRLLATSVNASFDSPADTTIRLWDVTTGELHAELVGHDNDVWTMLGVDNGTVLVSADEGGSVRRWEVPSGEPMGRPRSVGDAVEAMVVAGDEVVLLDRAGAIHFFDPRSGNLLHEAPDPSGALEWGTLATGGDVLAVLADWTVHLRDVVTGQRVTSFLTDLAQRESSVTESIALSPDGRYLVTGSTKGSLQVWERVSPHAFGQVLNGPAGSSTSAALNTDGTRLVTATGNEATAWTGPDPWRQSAVFRDHLGPVTGITFGPDDEFIATTGRDSAVRLWDPDTGEAIGPPLLHTTDPLITLWMEMNPGQPLPTATELREMGLSSLDLDIPTVWSLTFSDDGSELTTLSTKGVHRWDIESGDPIGEPRVWQESEWRIDDVTGTRVAAVLDDRVTLFDASHPESEALELKAAGPVTSVSYSPDGESIVIVDENSTVSLWDTSAATTVWTIEHDEPHVKTAFAPDSSFLAIWESDPSTGREDDPPDSDLRIVAVDSGEVVHGPTTFEEDLIRVWISPSQEFFATADYAGGFQMWDLAEGAPYGPRVGSEISHDELLWGPDDEFFVTLGTGGARAWPTPWDIDAACQMASPFVSEERLREHLPDDWEIRSCLGRDG